MNAYEFIRARLPKTENPRILDVGAGTGAFWHPALMHLRDKVVMLDIKPQFNKGLRGDATKMPIRSQSFTHVVSTYAIERTHDKQKTLKEISRVLEKGGTALLLSRHPDDHLIQSQLGFRPFMIAKLVEFLEAAERRGLKKGELNELKKIVVTTPPELEAIIKMLKGNEKSKFTYLQKVLKGQKVSIPKEIDSIRERVKEFVKHHFMNEKEVKFQLLKAGLSVTEVQLIESNGSEKTWGIVARKN